MGRGETLSSTITCITRLPTSAAFSFKSCRWGKQRQDQLTSESGFKEKPLRAKREGLLQLCLCQRSFIFPFHIYTNATFRMCRRFLLVYGDVFLKGDGESIPTTAFPGHSVTQGIWWFPERQEDKGTIEDEMIRWHYRLNGHEFEQN